MTLIRTIIVSLVLVSLIHGAAYAINFSFHNSLVDAADAGQTDVVRSLLKARQPVDGRGDFNTTALMRAAYRGNVEIAQMLIESGANLEIQDRGGATAMHIAARAGHVAIVKLLLQYGAQLDIKDKEGWTPLMRASMNKQAEVAKMLVDAGANIQAENEAGETPVMQAAASGSLDVLSALMQSPDFSKVTLSEKEEALALARKRKHRNIETVFQALIHPPAPPKGVARYGAPVYDGHGAWESRRETSPKVAQKSIEAESEQQMAEGQYPVQVPDNGFSEEQAAAPRQMQRMQVDQPDMPSQSVPQPLMPEPHARPQQLAQMPSAQTSGQARAMPTSLGQPQPSYVPAPVQSRWLLQLGAFANEDQAYYVWSNLKHRHPDMLGALEPDVIKAFLAYDQTEVYRLRAGGFGDREKAENVCRTMRERSIECYVIEQSSGGQMRAAPPAPMQQQMVQQQAPYAPTPVGGLPNANPMMAQAQANQLPMAAAPSPYAQQQQPMPAQASPYPVYSSQQQMVQAPSPAYGQPPAMMGTGMPPMQQQAPSYMPPMGSGPIDVMTPQQQAQSQFAYPQQGQYAAPTAAGMPPQQASNEDIREMARRQFLRSQGIQNPPHQEQYGDFYRDVQQLEQERQRYGGVSEAVRVNQMPAGASHANFGQQMNGIWVHVGDFPNEQYAQDYYQRMFKYDRSFAHLRMVSMKENAGWGANQSVAMRLGPSGSEAEAYEICRIVEQGGLNCNVLSDNSTAGYQKFTTLGLQTGQGIQQDTLDPFWLTLGTFEDAGDAEYYWMYLLEDQFDVLGALKYDLTRRAESAREPFHLKAGPFLVLQQANRVCDVLKYRNVACVVTH